MMFQAHFVPTQDTALRGGRLTKVNGKVASCAPAIGTLFLALSLTGSFAHAADLTWDTTTGDTAIVGGSGTWDAATQSWTSDTGTTNQVWTANDNATFGGTAGTVTVDGTQDVTNITFETGGYVLSGGALNYTNTGTGIDVQAGAATIDSDITSTTGLLKNGSGTLRLTGSNSISGILDVRRGSLALGAGSLSTVSQLVVQNGTSEVHMDLGGNTLTVTQFILNGTGTSTIDNGTLSFSGLGRVGSGTINAVLDGSGELRKDFSLTTTLNALNTLSGPVNILDGLLRISSSGSLLNTSGITIDAGGTLSVDGAGGNAVSDTGTIDNSGTFVLIGSNETVGSIFGSGNINLNDNTLTTGNASDAEISGVISGSGNLTKQGTGTLTLSGANTASGTLTNNAGTLVVSGTWAGDVNNNAVFDLTGTSTVNGIFTNNTTGSLTNSGGGAVQLSGLSGFISNGSIGSATGSITVNTENLTYRDNHAETGTVTFNVSDTITEERTAGPNWSGTGFTSNFATVANGVFTTGGDFTTTGSFTHNSTADLTISTGDTLTAGAMDLNANTVIADNGTLVATTIDNSATLNMQGSGSALTVTTLTNEAGGIVNAQGSLTGAVVNQGNGDFNITGDLIGITSFTNTGTATFDVAGDSSTIGSLTNTTTSGTGTTVNSFGSLYVTGAIVNGLVDGSAASVITNNWNLIGGSTIINHAGATLSSSTAVSALFGTDVTNNGVMNVQGRVDVTGITNSGSTAVFNVIGNTYGGGGPSGVTPSATPVGTFLNENGATVNIAGGELEISTFTNTSAGTGTTLATAGLQVASTGILDASAVTNSGTANNAGVIRANTVTNDTGGTLTNTGSITGTSVINSAGAVLTSTGTITGNTANSGIFNLNGTLLGTLENSGAGSVTTSGDVSGITTLTQNGSGLITISDGDTLEAQTITVAAGSAGLAIGAGSTLSGLGNTLNNSATINVASGGTIMDAGAINNLASGIINYADGGSMFADADSSGDEGISNLGTLNLNGGALSVTFGGAGTFTNGGQLNLASGSSMSVSNALVNSGTIDMQNSTVGETITINGDYVGGGTLAIDTDFAAGTSDTLVVNGDITGGTTSVVLTDLAGGAQDSSIVIASVTGAGAADAFALAAPLSIGAQYYGIDLVGSDYLLAAMGFINGTAGLEALPQTLLIQNELPTLAQRSGLDLDEAANFTANPRKAWIRVDGGNTEFAPAYSATGYTGEMDETRLRAGINFDAYSNTDGQMIIGVNTSYGKGQSDITAGTDKADIDTDAATLGLSATWYGASGLVIDGQVQYADFDTSISSQGVESKVDGKGYSGAIEVGKRIVLADTDWKVTPQVRLKYSSVEFDSYTSGGGLSVSHNGSDSKQLGIGLTAQKATQWGHKGQEEGLNAYGSAMVYAELDGESVITIDGVSLKSETEDRFMEVGAGVNWRFANGRNSIFAEAKHARSLDNSSGNNSTYITLGTTIRF